MKNKMVSVIYGFVMVMMIAAAYLVASDVLMPGNIILVAALAAASASAIIADIVYPRYTKRSHREIAAA